MESNPELYHYVSNSDTEYQSAKSSSNRDRAVEIDVGIACSCMPSLPAFFRQFNFPSLTRLLSRLSWRTRQSDSTSRKAAFSRYNCSSFRSPALKGPVCEGTRFENMFRVGIGELQSGWSSLDSNTTVTPSLDHTTSFQLDPEKGTSSSE